MVLLKKRKSATLLVALVILACLTTLFVSCKPDPEPEAKAEVLFVDNMMGSTSKDGTAEGDVASKDAMSEDAYIDVDGAIHGTFTAIDNTKFTAFWGEGNGSGKSYYACYKLKIDKLTATEEENGTFLFYIKTTGEDGDPKYGTSNDLEWVTVLGNSAEDAKKVKIEYYVVEGKYERIKNEDSDMSKINALLLSIRGEDTVYTFSVAADAKFAETEKK